MIDVKSIMTGHPQPIYVPGSGHEEDSKPAMNRQAPDDSAIEPSLANMQPQEPYGMSQAEEQVFQLQLQAAAAAANDEIVAPSVEQMTHDHAIRQRRLGRACDACSKRKVKCGDEVPCKNCVDLGVPCTFIRPAKRRGPANKVAEDLKRARYEVNDLNAPPITPALATSVSYLSLDSIAPFETIHRLLYDFFTYVYPIFPLPHEHLVMDRLRKREDVQNRSFCALVASLIAAISVMFPRIAQKALGQHEQDGHVIVNEVFIGRSLLICEQSRGPLSCERNVDDAATAFFVGLVSHLRKQPRQLEMYLTDALSIVRYLGVESDGVLADGSQTDFVTKELCRRVYWAIWSLVRSLQQIREIGDVIPARRASDLPPFPLLTDDYYIYIDRIQQQPLGQLSTLEGFNILSRIYLSCHPLIRFDVLDENDRQSESTKAQEVSVLKHILQNLDTILTTGHPELASLPNPSAFEAEDPVPSQQARMHIRWEVQKISFRSALISTRYYLAERLAAAQGGDDGLVQETRRGCLYEMAELASCISRASLEPVARLVVPRMQGVLEELKKRPPGIEEGSRDLEFLVGRSTELFAGY